MAVDYSKLSDDTLEKISKGHSIDYSTLPDEDLHEIARHGETVSSSPVPSTHSTQKISPLTGAELGIRHLGGAGPIAAGAAEAVPDWFQKLTSGPTPDLNNKKPNEIMQALKGKSPTQVNAALKAFGLSGDIGPTSSADLYQEAKEPNEALYHEAQKQQPLATGLGTISGDVLAYLGLEKVSPTFMATSKAAEGAGLLSKAATAGKNIAAHAVNAFIPSAELGAMESKNKLVGGNTDSALGLAKDAAKAGATGSLVVGGLSALGEGISGIGNINKAAKESKFAKDVKGYYDIGKEGKDLSSETTQIGSLNNPQSLQDPVSLHDTNSATEILGTINKIDDHLGEQVGATVNNATQHGINMQADMNMAKKIDDVFENAPEALNKDVELVPDEDKFDNNKLKGFFDYAKKYKTEGLTPVEMQQFRNELGNMQRRINYSDPYLASDIRGLVSNLTSELKINVPGYEAAAERLSDFRKQVPETILSKDNPADITRLRMSGIRNVDTRLVNQMKSVIRGLNDPSNLTARGSYTNLLKGLQQFHTNELMRQASGKQLQTAFDAAGVSPQAIESSIKTAATKSKLLQDYTGLSGFNPVKLLGKNPSQVIKQPLGWAANKLGHANSGQNPVVDASRKLYNASDEALESFASKLSKIPAQKGTGTALQQAITSKDRAAKNSILFSIMQNPELRNLIHSNEFNVGIGD